MSSELRMTATLGRCVSVIIVLSAAASNNSNAGSPDGDFQRRASGPDVVLHEGFDSEAGLAKKRFPDARQEYVTFDPTVKASGSGSLRFEIPSNSYANSSGSWRTNFADDNYSVKFGAGDDLYVQWRQRFSRSMLDTIYDTVDGSGGGWKQAIIGQGDKKGWNYGDAGEVGSCTALEIVIQNVNQRNFPQMYTNCGDYAPLQEFFSSKYNQYDYKLQNAVDNAAGRDDSTRFVLYSQEGWRVSKVRADFPGMAYHPDEWMTFQVHIAPGVLGCAVDPLVNAERCGFTSSRVELWVAREGRPSVKVVDVSGIVLRRYDGAKPSDEAYGKIWFTPYHTNKDPSQIHPVGFTWYDELIVSRSRIPDPR